MTLNEIVYDIMELMRAMLSDDEDFDPRQVAYWVKTQRALWVSREIGKGGGEPINPTLEQDLGCVELTAVDSAECSIDGGCIILRTLNKIPSVLSDGGRPLITRVGPIDKRQLNFTLVPYERSKYVGVGRFSKHSVQSYYMNGYIYIAFPMDYKEPSLLTYINIRGVFEDPEAVAAFSDCDGLACYTSNSPYPVPARFIDFMKDYIIKNYANRKMMLPSDAVNDGDGAIRNGVPGGKEKE